MPQFDVFRSAPRSVAYPLLVDLQADVHSKLDTRIVVPLMTLARFGSRPPTRVTPVVAVRGEDYVAMFPSLAAVPRTALGELVGSLASQRATLIAALDLLITGS
jgi:toxin CcdB